MQRELTPTEIDDLLNRQFELNGRVQQHIRLFYGTGQWDQVRFLTFSDLPIPTRGRAVRDDVYGTVVVFPDATGMLHFSGNVAPAVGDEINKPTYVSPSGNSVTQLLADIQSSFGKIGAALFVLAAAYIVVLALK